MVQVRRDIAAAGADVWPALPLEEWKDSYETLHLWSQIVGKIALASAPLVNHWWQATLRVTARGLETLPLSHGDRTFQIAFNLVHQQLRIRCSDGGTSSIALRPRSVADFYGEVMDTLESLGLGVKIWTRPVEIADPIPFEQDHQHASYDPEYARRFWQILLNTERVFARYRSRFLGKSSPIQFFWGSFDLALTRFSGRRAPEYTGGAFNVGRWVMEEAYSHEVSSLGFWPGGGATPYPAYYAYSYPEPEGYAEAKVGPEGAFYSKDLGEFLLPYDVVRQSEDPSGALMEFAESSYGAAADRGGWDRASLERHPEKAGRRVS